MHMRFHRYNEVLLFGPLSSAKVYFIFQRSDSYLCVKIIRCPTTPAPSKESERT